MAQQPVWPGHAAALLPRRRTSAFTVVTMLVLGLSALAIAVLTLLVGGPVEVLVSSIAAAISCPLVVWLCFWLDRYEPEPGGYRVAALVWGAGAAAVIGGGLSLLLIRLVDASQTVAAVVWAPFTEEFGKGLFLVLLVLLRRQQMHGILDGIIYASLIGVGFAFAENVLYYQAAFAEGGLGGLTVLFVVRGVISPFAHPLFTSVFGIGMGVAVTTRSPRIRVLAPTLGYLGAVLLHAIWNGSVTFYSVLGFVGAYLVIMLPALGLILSLALWVRDREGAMLSSALTQCARQGLVDPADVDLVARIPARLAARRYARAHGGRPAARVMESYQRTLTEMAFLHRRLAAEPESLEAGARMGELAARAGALRPYLLRPPPPVGLGLPPTAPPPPPADPSGSTYSPIPGPP